MNIFDISELIQIENTRLEVNRHLPVFYIKESENKFVLHENYMGTPNFVLVNIHSETWPPVKLSIDTEMNSFTFLSFLLLFGDWVASRNLFQKKMFTHHKNRALTKYKLSNDSDMIWRPKKPEK